MSPREAWLTFRIHRFEVLVAVAAFSVLTSSSWIAATHLDGIVVSPECGTSMDRGSPTATCLDLVRTWSTVLLPYLPAIIGLILGVPIVARELEARTVSLAWSLQGTRWRWLLSWLSRSAPTQPRQRPRPTVGGASPP